MLSHCLKCYTKNELEHIVYLAPTVLDYSYFLERCKYLDPFQNRSVLLLFRRFLFLSRSVIFLLLRVFCRN